MTIAKKLISETEKNELVIVGADLAVEEDQNWDEEKTTLFFEDGSGFSLDSWGDLLYFSDKNAEGELQ